MVGRFSLSSLPSIPASLADLLNTSPQVFYPPSRPASRSSTTTTTTTTANSSVPSSCPSSPRRRPVVFPDDRGVAPLAPPPPPFWSGSAHPHTDAPLKSRERSHTDASGRSRERSQSQLPPRQSSLFNANRGDPQWQPVRPPRPSHRRSQSAAPGHFAYTNVSNHVPSTAPVMRVEPRSLHPSASAASLPTLAEDDAPPQPVFERRPSLAIDKPEERRATHSRRWSWREPPPPAEERTRRRAQSTVTMTSVPGLGTFVEPPLPERLRRRHSQIVGLPSAPVLSKPPTPVCPSTPSRSRRGSVCSITFPDGVKASPTPVQTSISVSDVAALATWSEEPVSPTLARSQSTRESVTSPSESLRARLRTLSKLEGRDCPSTPPRPARRNTLASPHSTVVTPGHGTPATPGSSTPTTSSCSHMPPPLSPTPTRARRNLHRHTLSFPYAEESRPTTSRLRQPAQLSMAPVLDDPQPHRPPRSRPVSMLGPPSPPLASSPGSLVSDTGSSSPTASIESLTLSPAWLNLNLTLTSQQKRSSIASVSSITDRDRDKRHSISDKRHSISSIASLSRRGSQASTHAHDYRRGTSRPPPPPPSLNASSSRVTVSLVDDIDGERFLDFDDI